MRKYSIFNIYILLFILLIEYFTLIKKFIVTLKDISFDYICVIRKIFLTLIDISGSK